MSALAALRPVARASVARTTAVRTMASSSSEYPGYYPAGPEQPLTTQSSRPTTGRTPST